MSLWKVMTYELADRTATQYDWLLASSCRLSVRLSVCDAVHCGSRQGRCTGPTYRVNTCTSMPCFSRQVPICPFKHFCCRMYHLATKRAWKKPVEENANLSFFETHNQACTASMVTYLLLFTPLGKLCSVTLQWAPYVGLRTLPSGYIRRLQVGAFTNCIRKNPAVNQPNVCTS